MAQALELVYRLYDLPSSSPGRNMDAKQVMELEKCAESKTPAMSEVRKFAILFAATILAARKLIDMDSDKPNMAKSYFVEKAIEDAAFILERIDKRWPAKVAAD